MRAHLYCSTRCAREAGRAAWRNEARKRLSRPVSSRLAVVLVLIALGAPTLFALRVVSQLDRLNAPAPFARPRAAASARIESVGADPAGGVRIEGTAAPGNAVFLFAEGRLAATAFAENGRFRFEGVRAPGPYRVGALSLSSSPGAAGPADPSLLSAPPVGSERTTRPEAGSSARDFSVESGDSNSVERAPTGAGQPRSTPFLRIPDLTRGPADRREILVSFDGGSTSRGAREILDALRMRGIHTTVFLSGDFIRHYPELTRQIAADGHEVGNHTDTHPHLTTYASDGRQATRSGVDRSYLAAELARAAHLYREATGREMSPIWRAPYGEQNAEIRSWAAEAGYWHVGWTGGRAGLDGMDWVSDPASRAYRSSERVVARLIANAENGGIVLLHLGSDRDDPVAPRVSELLDGLLTRGFRLVKASAFLEREGMTPESLARLARGAGR
jgi:peptidoglycan/xylan/chitin deacetylase (PgdA/CDA1 family)